MNLETVFIGVAIVSGVALVLGLLLALADKLFKVEVNPLIEQINQLLPGINCGACGFPGCNGLAEALADGSQPTVNCKPISAEKKEELIALLKSQGSNPGSK